MLTDSDGVTHSVYCVESGIPYNTSENTYTSENGTNSDYLNMLPSAARRGITLTAIYGWKPGASPSCFGINEDDYKMATQIILWEYQQQLRSDPYSRHSNGHASADQYYSVVAGRPAEKAYNWILEQVASHSTVPSFTAANKGDAPVLELKWDTSRKGLYPDCYRHQQPEYRPANAFRQRRDREQERQPVHLHQQKHDYGAGEL